MTTSGRPSGVGDDGPRSRPRSTRSPSMATMRSPARRPICDAGVATPSSNFGATSATVDVAFPLPVMNRIVKRTIASTMFAAGPGGDGHEPLPGRRLPVRVRPDRVAELVQALLDAGRGGRRELLLGGGLLELVERRADRLELAALEGLLDALVRPGQRRRLVDRALRSAARRRAAPGGASPGWSRTRRAGSRRARTRCRSSWSSRSRAGSPRRTAAAEARPPATRRSAPPRG